MKGYANGTSKGLVRKKEEIECSNIIKGQKKYLTFIILQNKT